MPLDSWLAYAALCATFAMSPGPAILLTMSQAMARGFRAGTEVIGGVQVGNAVYVLLSGLGLGAVLATSETAFLVIKYAGALYLILLGARMIARAREAAAQPAVATALWQAPFTQGMVNQLANPKAILFYAALFPQFIDYRGGDVGLQIVILAVTDLVIEVPILMAYAYAAARGGRLLGSGRALVWRERVAGMALVGVGGALSLVRKGA